MKVRYDKEVDAAFIEFSRKRPVGAVDEVQRGSTADSETVRNLMDTRYRHTLGRLVRDVASHFQLDDKLTGDLEEALEKRNWFIHHSMREYSPAAFYPEVRALYVAKIREARSSFERVSDAIHEEVVRRLESTGLSRDELEARIQMKTEAYVQRILNNNGENAT